MKKMLIGVSCRHFVADYLTSEGSQGERLATEKPDGVYYIFASSNTTDKVWFFSGSPACLRYRVSLASTLVKLLCLTKSMLHCC